MPEGRGLPAELIQISYYPTLHVHESPFIYTVSETLLHKVLDPVLLEVATFSLRLAWVETERQL